MATLDFHNHWQRLMSLATLGTARQANNAADIWPATQGSLAATAPESQSPATQLLRAAAATHLLTLAAQRVAPGSFVKPDIDQTEPARYCNENACWRLARLLVGDMRILLGEWCSLAQGANRVLPPHWLPSIAQAANEDEKVSLQAVMGLRAQWLARQQASDPPALSAVPDVDAMESFWQQGTQSEREALLVTVRPSQPALSRKLIQQTWDEDSPDARTAFLKLIAGHVGPEDEPLLEQALNDKRKAVRVAAADCLTRLKGSAHQQRMIARVAPLITFNANAKSGLFGMKRPATLGVTLPQALAVDAVRDGIDSKPPAQRKIGERSYWLLQMLSIVEPGYWSNQFSAEPAVVLAAMRANDEAALLVEAIAAATVHHENADWALALCNAWVDNADESFRSAAPLPPLLSVLASTTRNELVTDLLGKAGQRNPELIFVLLDAAQGQWSDALTQRALAALTQQLKSDNRQWAHPRDTLQAWATRADIDVATPMLSTLQSACKDPSPWNAALQRFCEIIEFRHAMRAELIH